MSEASRIAAVRAACHLQTLSGGLPKLLDDASKINAWIVAGNPADPENHFAGTPSDGSADAAKAPGEAPAQG